MDAKKNPYAPGAGNQPPELAGRDHVLHDAEVALVRVKDGRHDRGHLLLGLRGVGKTVLLRRIEALARQQDYLSLYIEARATIKLTELLVPRLRELLVALSGRERAKEYARQALGALRSFASAFRVTVADFEFEVQERRGSADSGTLEIDLPDLLTAVAQAAAADGAAVALLIDEVQYLTKAELSALIVAFHQLSQRGLPLILFGAGLPQLAGYAGSAQSYAERLFRYPAIGPLPPDAAAAAIRKPAREAGADITEEALAHIVDVTEGYAFFLQMWGSHAWRVAPHSPITLEDVQTAGADALRDLDQDFFNVRFNRLTAREKDYLRAMAELGPGPSRSGDIARVLGIDVTAASPLRTGLIRKGMVYQSDYGYTAFTVPMFDAFMRRTMPLWMPPVAGESVGDEGE